MIADFTTTRDLSLNITDFITEFNENSKKEKEIKKKNIN